MFRLLREFQDYDVYAWGKFEEERDRSKFSDEWTANVGSYNVGCRERTKTIHDDRGIELWKTRYTWIDYRAKFYENELTSLT